MSRSTSSGHSHDVVVDPSRTSFVLNPGGDLKNTQKTFEPWLEERKEQAAWTGVVARAPLEEEVKAALTQKELFLYVFFFFLLLFSRADLPSFLATSATAAPSSTSARKPSATFLAAPSACSGAARPAC